MDAFERYSKWCEVKMEDADLAAELTAIKDNKDEIYERFYTDLVFGTGGLRGVLGAGNNRMNLYTVRRATQGICTWLKNSGKECSAAVSYDSRNKSELFAKATAEVFAANGIKVYIYDALAPTPLLSWAVRYYGCDTGVMITASHNPAEYNGYKAYDNNGCQITDKAAAEILDCVDATDLFEGVLTCDFDKAVAEGKIEYVSEKAIADYYAAILACRCDTEAFKDSDLKITYTALNGTGNVFVRHILNEIGAAEPVL
ncbi:MAG: phospho-sugar mutase, partial [Oscillospiraceae bacterium]|nr:phospho-sugar mutase [Oscillospiraceae bacterium]